MAQLKAGSTVDGKRILTTDDSVSGAVRGPGSAIDGDIAQFDGASGEAVKGGIQIGVAANNVLQLNSLAKVPDNLVATASIADGAVTGVKLPAVTAGIDTVLVPETTYTGSMFTNTSYAKKMQWQVKRKGVVRVTSVFGCVTGAPGIAYLRIYVNGVAIGNEHKTSTSSATVTDDIAVVSDDLIQVYVKTNNSIYNGTLTSMKITCDDPLVNNTVTQY